MNVEDNKMIIVAAPTFSLYSVPTKIFLKDIPYIEGLKDFIKVHTPQKVFVVSERLSYMEDKLPENKFACVHKSYIIALDKIKSVQTEQANQ